ncbi:hypothetical protein [Pedobacter heparinus]|uniref:hypothetical protein n=1 Tax=Pedobacter heparinus TaxID=984 RepID=UPI00292DBF17|nr:hypothetical protein [Pedobacter heparinus]
MFKKAEVIIYSACILLIWGIASLLIRQFFEQYLQYYLQPTIAMLSLFGIFTIFLKWKVGDNLFGEIGFLYLGLLLVYTLFPAFAFIAAQDSSDPLSRLLPSPPDLSIHLWRHVLFFTAIGLGYILWRGTSRISSDIIKKNNSRNDLVIFFLFILIGVCLLSTLLLSAPVASYYDHYTRYDHLPWIVRKFVSLCVRFNQGFYSLLLLFLFLDYKKYKFFIPIVVVVICTYEIVYSFGSRIQALIILLESFCLYNFLIKKVTLRKGLIVGISLAALFSVVEFVRQLGSVSDLKDSVSSDGIKSASEFGAVYYPGFHLYAERNANSLPSVEWEMFFNDFISIVTFGDFERWNPMAWYAKNYFPESTIAPFTLGPIADSAIWGGEIDLFFRGLINGMFFAFIMKWFIKRSSKWWSVIIYVYCYATCILTLKYTIFYHLTPLVKTILPVILIVLLIRRSIEKKKNNTYYRTT